MKKKKTSRFFQEVGLNDEMRRKIHEWRHTKTILEKNINYSFTFDACTTVTSSEMEGYDGQLEYNS